MPRGQQKLIVERILRAQKCCRERGYRRVILVKWKGQKMPTWEPRSHSEQTVALEKFEENYCKDNGMGERNVDTQIGKHKNIISQGGVMLRDDPELVSLVVPKRESQRYKFDKAKEHF